MMIDKDKYVKYFLSDDPSSIYNQIADLIFHDCFYRTFNYGIGIEMQKNNYKPSFFLEQYQDNSFLRQAVYLRKLFEFPKRDERMSIYSILTVIQEIEKDHSSFTFSNFVNLPIQDFNKSRMTDTIEGLVKNSRTTIFKVLSQNSNPNPDDTISLPILREIKSNIENAKKRLDYHLNKYWLHCSDPNTRNNLELETQLLTLNYLQNLLKTAVWSIKTVSKYVDIFVLCEMPTITFDPFIGCNIIFSPSTLKKCDNFFHKRYNLYDSWSRLYSKDELIYTNLRDYRT